MKKILFILALAAMYGCAAPDDTVVLHDPEPVERIFEPGPIVGDACDGIPVEERLDCQHAEVMKVAVQNLNIDTCDAIVNGQLKIVCQDNVLSNRAVMENDLELCNQLNEAARAPSCQDAIYHTRALAQQDSSHCANIQDANLRQQCEAGVA